MKSVMAKSIGMPQRQVTVIPANPRLNRFSGKEESDIIDVCAYARVSTDDEDQINSYEAQKDYYEEKIKSNSDWQFAGIFADEGITGTSMEKRKDFNRMMRQCRHGKIKLILCKSVSRWARNTVDGLNTVRELKSRGVAVYFEKENINTLKETSEFLITLFAGFAQAESESLSANVRWGMQKNMRDGKVHFQYKKILGYERGEDGNPKIIPQEAEIVRRIYMDYLAGYSLKRIMDELNEDEIPSPRGIKQWAHTVILSILTNEKYKGDALLQKTYTVDCISKKVRKNNGELPMYLVKNNHEAIISPEMFSRVQEEMARRSSLKRVDQKNGRTKQGKFSSKYALTGKLICGECGAPYKRVTWARNGKKRILWRCVSRLENGTKFCKQSPSIDEPALHNTIVAALMRITETWDQVETFVKESTAAVVGGGETEGEIASLEVRREELASLLSSLTDKMLEGASDETAIQLQAAVKEKADIDGKLREYRQRISVINRDDSRMNEIFEILDSHMKRNLGYDDRLAAAVIDRISIGTDEALTVRLVNGFEINANI
ncbi:MAG: recombinase family protein [Christensenellales bacterium]|jgi:site-specific DNA recombinase